MLRRIIATLSVAILFAGIALAKDYKGTLTSIAEDGKTIKVKIDDKETEFKVGSDAEFISSGKGGKEMKMTADKAYKALNKKLAKGVAVEFETKGEGDKEEVVKVTVKGGKGKKTDK